MRSQLGPARVEKRLHAVAGLADGRVVLVERDAVDEHEVEVGAKVVPRLVQAVVQFFADGAQVHGRADDLFVGGELFRVDGQEEGPGLFVRL